MSLFPNRPTPRKREACDLVGRWVRIAGVRVSMATLVGRATAVTLSENPEGNAKIIWGRPWIKDEVDVYFQADLHRGYDLSGVVVRDAGNKTPLQVAADLKAGGLALRAGRDRQHKRIQAGWPSRLPAFVLRWLLKTALFLEHNLGLTLSWFGMRKDGFGTVMVSNVGQFGIDQAFAPLIPVSRVPIVVLMGRVTKQPWVVDGEVQVRPILTVSATFDHRVVDGFKIGRIIRRFRRYMEEPAAEELRG